MIAFKIRRNAPPRSFAAALCLALALASGCGGSDETGGSTAASASSSAASGASTSANVGSGGAGGAGSTTTTGAGGAGGQVASLEGLLEALRTDRDTTVVSQGNTTGWPAPVEGGYLFVSTKASLDLVTGDFDSWAGTPMNHDTGFSWLVVQVASDTRYKFTDLTTYEADPWSRSYTYDEFGEMSLALATAPHLDRFFSIGDAKNEDRTVRVWVPQEPIDRVLYVHDGQNLFDPEAFFGGWHLQDSAPAGMLLVGIDNTSARMEEYTHVQDDIGSGPLGGEGDAYADYLEGAIRPLIQAHYGEPGPIGVMGSSLGGLISLHIADKLPGTYAFAASLSGTVGWGSIGLHNETMIERLAAHGHGQTALYVDSGGSGTCFDSDSDGIEDDDPGAFDNYCENAQLAAALTSVGYVDGVDLFYYWEPGAEHNEAEWAARVYRPLQAFAGL